MDGINVSLSMAVVLILVAALIAWFEPTAAEHAAGDIMRLAAWIARQLKRRAAALRAAREAYSSTYKSWGCTIR